jgi:streptogramin lyase
MGPIVPTMSLPISTTTFIVDWPEPPLAAAIAVGPDGALWFTGAAWIGRATTDGDTSYFDVPGPARAVHCIAAGPDDCMWFGEQSGTVGKISLSGQITEFELPARDAFDHDITSGPDGNLWSTFSSKSDPEDIAIGSCARVPPGTAGVRGGHSGGRGRKSVV